MRRSAGLSIWTRIVLEAGGAVALLRWASVAELPPTVSRSEAIVVGSVVGTALVALLAPRRGILLRTDRARVPVLAAKGLVLAVGSASEEVYWRWFAIGVLAPRLGLAPAYVVTTVAFATAHSGRRSRLVHLATGAAFGGVFLGTGSLSAAVTAHVTYNLLVLVASEGACTAALARVCIDPAVSTGKGGPDEVAVQLREVEKSFGETRALRRLSLSVHTGETVAVLGPNGAGKTTAIRIMLGLRRPDAGAVELFGAHPGDYRSRLAVGATPQETGFPGTLRVREVVGLAAAHFPKPLSTGELLARFDLDRLEARQIGGLSGGERRRLAVALAFVGRPRAVFLDEPTVGLDVSSRRHVWIALQAYASEGGTALLTTHHLEEAEALASRVVILSSGEVIRDGTVSEIKGGIGLTRIRVRSPTLPELAGARVFFDRGVWTILTSATDDVVRALVRGGIRLDDLEIAPVSLETAFMLLTAGEP